MDQPCEECGKVETLCDEIYTVPYNLCCDCTLRFYENHQAFILDCPKLLAALRAKYPQVDSILARSAEGQLRGLND